MWPESQSTVCIPRCTQTSMCEQTQALCSVSDCTLPISNDGILVFETGLLRSIKGELGRCYRAITQHARQPSCTLSYRAGHTKPCALARGCLFKRASACRIMPCLTQDWNITTRGPVRLADDAFSHDGSKSMGRGRFSCLCHLRRRTWCCRWQWLLVRARGEAAEARSQNTSGS